MCVLFGSAWAGGSEMGFFECMGDALGSGGVVLRFFVAVVKSCVSGRGANRDVL